MEGLVRQKITIKKHLSHLWPLLIFVLILLFIVLYDWAIAPENRLPILIVYSVLLSVSLLHLYLHFEYYFINRGVQLVHNKLKNTLTYIVGGRELVIGSSEIKKIELNQSRFYKKRGGFLTTDNYHFHKIFLKGGEVIVITSLLYSDMDSFLTDVLEKKERTIASLNIPSLD